MDSRSELEAELWWTSTASTLLCLVLGVPLAVVLARAGLDPEKPPATWKELEETARKYHKIWEMACFGGFLNGRETPIGDTSERTACSFGPGAVRRCTGRTRWRAPGMSALDTGTSPSFGPWPRFSIHCAAARCSRSRPRASPSLNAEPHR